LNYIEICSGPGRCIFRETKEEVDGSAISILRHNFFPFINRALFVDYSQKTVDILNQRIKHLGKDKVACAYNGDYNNPEEISHLLSFLNRDCLNLVFLDPTDCSLPFNTINAIDKKLGRVDFIINFAIFSDAARHLRHVFLFPDRFQAAIAKYSKFLGDNHFFMDPDNKRLAQKDGTEEDLRMAFLEQYCSSFKKLGYNFFDYSIRVKGYYLFFASKSEIAFNFWKRIQMRDEHGQTNFLALLE
jgi:three-Cys-motif partner protein